MILHTTQKLGVILCAKTCYGDYQGFLKYILLKNLIGLANIQGHFFVDGGDKYGLQVAKILNIGCV